MDVHPPHQPILSFKEAVVHLAIVTVGILIALSLEGLLEWIHHRHMIREANENITRELEGNRNELQDFLKAVPELRSNETQIVTFINAMLAHNAPATGKLKLGFVRSDLSDSSWTTAQTTGALGLMRYQDVKRYASAYELQSEFMRLQENTTDAVISALTAFNLNVSPDKLPPDDLRQEREKVMTVMSNLQAEEQIGQALDKRYLTALGKH